jgi:hypothetical protein
VKKGFSILFALVMIVSSAHLTIATHYCGGKVAGRVISLSGKLATCGMEKTGEICPSHGNRIATHCCDNKVLTIGIVNFFTSPVSIHKDNTQNIQDLSCLPVNQFFRYISDFNYAITDIHPPGGFSIFEVDLNEICAYRI